MAVYFSMGIHPSMFPKNCEIVVEELTIPVVQLTLESHNVCYALRPFHVYTVGAAKARYNLPIEIPREPIQVGLEKNDCMIVMSANGLPRLEKYQEEYTREQVFNADFAFTLWSVV